MKLEMEQTFLNAIIFNSIHQRNLPQFIKKKPICDIFRMQLVTHIPFIFNTKNKFPEMYEVF